ncbi:hypothetical protein GCM10023225_30730 [Kineococcus glutinatus]|uniref:Uncharacterized protein n=1 Tax=Kineococcus glutinatus TaxID=1070872 RepID=A0ABP9IAU9_9ACTN
MTFGPRGRVVCTLVWSSPLLLPVVLPGPGWPIFWVFWLVVAVPWGLRDIWRRV